MTIRHIIPEDNGPMAAIIRASLTQYGLNQPGTVYFDPDTDRLYELFRVARSAYFIAENNGDVVGGAGIYPSNGLPEGTCELSKMYVRDQERGLGLGTQLLQACISYAGDAGYHHVYLESMPELVTAIRLYEKYGFEHIRGPLGDTGHYFCQVWMRKSL